MTLASLNLKSAEYQILVENGSEIQSQKILVMQNGTTAYSNEYAIMYDVQQLVSVGATISSGALKLMVTPETGTTGLTTYRFVRGGLI